MPSLSDDGSRLETQVATEESEVLPVLAEPVRHLIEADSHRIIEIFKEYAPSRIKRQNGWLVASARVPDSPIFPGAPVSGAFTCIEIAEPEGKMDPQDGEIVRQITYFEEVEYEGDESARQDLMTIQYVHGLQIVPVEIYDPALRRRFNSPKALDNIFALDVDVDLKDTYEEIMALPLGSVALEAPQAA